MDYLKLMMEHKKKPLNIIQVCKIGMRTVEQLKVLHDKLYLHHDVKPNNILSNYTKQFTTANKAKDEDMVTLIDFGCSELHGKEVKQSLGHPAFQSRYVLSGFKRTWRDDMIALLYTLIYLV